MGRVGQVTPPKLLEKRQGTARTLRRWREVLSAVWPAGFWSPCPDASGPLSDDDSGNRPLRRLLRVGRFSELADHKNAL